MAQIFRLKKVFVRRLRQKERRKSSLEAIEPGSPIPGSKMFRAICRRCNEPMRVTKYNTNTIYICLDCGGSENRPIDSINKRNCDRNYHGSRGYQGPL